MYIWSIWLQPCMTSEQFFWETKSGSNLCKDISVSWIPIKKGCLKSKINNALIYGEVGTLNFCLLSNNKPAVMYWNILQRFHTEWDSGFILQTPTANHPENGNDRLYTGSNTFWRENIASREISHRKNTKTMFSCCWQQH